MANSASACHVRRARKPYQRSRPARVRAHGRQTHCVWEDVVNDYEPPSGEASPLSASIALEVRKIFLWKYYRLWPKGFSTVSARFTSS